MRLDGSKLRQLVQGNAGRWLVKLSNGELLYLENGGDRLLVLRAEAGKEPVKLAEVPGLKTDPMLDPKAPPLARAWLHGDRAGAVSRLGGACGQRRLE